MVSNVYPDHRYFFLESGNSDNDLQLGANSSSVRGKQISNFYNRRETFRDKYKNCFLDMRVKLNCLESLYICRTHYSYFKYREVPSIVYIRESKTKNQVFISKIDLRCHRDLILGFQKWKSAKNWPRNSKICPKPRQKWYWHYTGVKSITFG